MNPYLVVPFLDVNRVQEEANKQWNNGYEIDHVVTHGGGNFDLIFILRTAKAAANRTTVAGAGSSQ